MAMSSTNSDQAGILNGKRLVGLKGEGRNKSAAAKSIANDGSGGPRRGSTEWTNLDWSSNMPKTQV
jgi:hypothetical protein